MESINFPSLIYRDKFNNIPKNIVDGQVITFNLQKIELFDGSFSPNYGILTFCKKGRGKAIFNNQETEVSAGDICIIAPYSIMTFDEVSDNHELFVVLFEENSMFTKHLKNLIPTKIQMELLHRPVLKPKAFASHVVEQSISLFEEISQNSLIPNRLDLLENILMMFFKMIYKSSMFEFKLQDAIILKSRSEYIFEAFAHEVAQHYAISRKVNYYADLLCITPNYLLKVCNQVAHTSPQNYINNYVFMQAQHLLLNKKEKSLQEIADELGFSTQAFFTNFFKRAAGMSPSEYRLQ